MHHPLLWFKRLSLPFLVLYSGSLSLSGNFPVSREHLKEKALPALLSLRRYTNLSKLKAALAFKIFDTMIYPIPTYISEIWSLYVKPHFKIWDCWQIEKTHLQFCKRYMEVNNKSPNIACRAELGRFPLNITINKKNSQINFVYTV